MSNITYVNFFFAYQYFRDKSDPSFPSPHFVACPKSPATEKKINTFLSIFHEASTHIVGIKRVSRSSGLSYRKE